MAQEAQRIDAQLWIIYVPSIQEAGGQDKFHEMVVQIIDELGLPFIDLLPAIQSEGGASLYYPKDGHWRAQGHALAAEVIYQSLPLGQSLSTP